VPARSARPDEARRFDDRCRCHRDRSYPKEWHEYRALYYTSAVLASADYTVEADVYVASSVTNDRVGVVGRPTPRPTGPTTGRTTTGRHKVTLSKQ
jgi:hypothetical protein